MTVEAAAEVAPSVPASASEAPANPRLVALHRAVRAAIVIPATFAISLLVIRDLQLATFAVFGCFSLLVLADFGGLRPARAAAYVGTALGGAILVTLGTAVSPNAAVAAAVMLVLGFTVAFGGVFGGYVAAAQTPLLLAFVLAVSIPAPLSAIPTRVGGWLLAGAVSTLAGLFLWPWFERVALRKRAAEACIAVAALVASERHHPGDDATAPLTEVARGAVAAVRGEYVHTSMRPAGPTSHDRAFVELVTQIAQIVDLLERPFYEQRQNFRPCTDEGRHLAAAVTAALRASAGVLTGGAPPDIRAVESARRAHRAALDDWAAEQLRDGRAAEEVLQGIDVDHTLRVIAYLTIALSANAVIAAGGRPHESFPLPAAIPRHEGARGVAVRTLRTVRTHLEPTSTVLHSSLRVAVGLALSVFLARTLGLGHAFWVVLGTLSVLRSNALGTGRTTVQAIAGSVIGFVGGGLFASVAGKSPVLMWIALPVALFLASYAASAFGFIAGQAAFTVTVILIFNLISPAGWQVGLVRVEDVAVGIYLERAFGLILGGDTAAEITPARADAVRARDRAGEAFDVFLNERGSRHLEPQTAARLVSSGSQALLAGDLLVVVAADLGYRADLCLDGATMVETEVRTLLAGMRQLAGELGGTAPGGAPTERPSVEAVRHAAIGCMRRAGSDEAATHGAMAVVIAGEWVQNLARMEADLEQPVRAAVEAAATRWWR